MSELKICASYIFMCFIFSIHCSINGYTFPNRINENNDSIYKSTNNDNLIIKEKIKTNKNKKIKISNKGKSFIKSYESLSLVSYRIKGESSNTIGYGHKINSDDPIWLRKKYIGESISKQQAEEIFNYDIENFVEPALNRIYNELDSLNVSTEILNSNFWDSMGSLIFNCGPTGIKNTKFYSLLKRNRIRLAIKEVNSTHVYLNGHKQRRLKEQELMMDIYS